LNDHIKAKHPFHYVQIDKIRQSLRRAILASAKEQPK
jgi:hypothetical protein